MPVGNLPLKELERFRKLFEFVESVLPKELRKKTKCEGVRDRGEMGRAEGTRTRGLRMGMGEERTESEREWK